MELAISDMYRAVWTARIHEEWIRAVLRARPDLSRARLDADDRHVLAAAIASGASTIVTANVKDFPDSELAPMRIRAAIPDDFLSELFLDGPSSFLTAARTVRMRLRQPSASAASYLGVLEAQGLRQTVELLRPYERYL